MKLHRILAWFVPAAVAGLVMAEEPPLPSGQALGMIEGILERCAGVDPKSAAQYRQRVQMLTSGLSEEVVAEIRKSDEYRASFDSITQSLAQVSEPEAMQACTHSLAESR